jgi:two-component system, NtrC family, sensor kinase
MNKLAFSLIIIILMFLNIDSKANIQFNNENKLLNISSELLILQDSFNELNIQDVILKKFEKSSSAVPNLGISKAIFWVKIPITNNSSIEHLLLEISSPNLDYLEFYTEENKNYSEIKTGDEFPFNERHYKDPNYIFDLNILKGETKTYYLKVRSNEAIQLPIKIGTQQNILSQNKKRDLLSGIYTGIMLAMILYNIFIYITVKDKSYILYVIYILSILLTQLSLQGYTFQYLWPENLFISKYSLIFLPSISGITGLIFMNSFLKTIEFSKRLYILSIILIVPYFLSYIISFLGHIDIGQIIIQMNSGIISIFMLYIPIKIYKKGYKPAKYFIIAWSAFLTGVIIFILKDADILPFNNFTRFTMQIGSAVETVLLSFALAARINQYKKEKEELILNQNVVLEKTVIERTLKLENTLVDLKETQSQLVDAEKMSSLGQLTAGIAHEINNPINFVSSNIPPLKQDLDDINNILKKYEEITPSNIDSKLKEIEALKQELDFEYLKTELPTIISGIEDGAKRTQEIVNGLRNFSRLDEIELQLANVNEGIESTLVLIKNKLNSIKLIKNIETIIDIECYPGKLNQLFMNVIDNAIGAIEAKKSEDNGEISLSTYNDTNYVYIKIKDNGIGMNTTTKSKMFEPFFTTKPVGSGTGLGLSIAHTIIKNHNGEIQVDTEENVGTEITIKLPIKQ